jgi:NTP pyrophosphatase (non-canonical NTP hydrolase)
MTIKDFEVLLMEQAKAKGFGTSKEDILVAEKIALIHSEISEAYEAYRHKKIQGPHGFAEELSDAVQRIIHLCALYEIDLEREMLKKLKKNQKRQWNASKMNENLKNTQ